MAIQLSAPYPYRQMTTLLPNPVWDDSVALQDELMTKYAIDGTAFTYVKSQGHRRKLQMTIHMFLAKAAELQAFCQNYFSYKIYLKDHLSQEWVGYLMNNPFEFTTDEYAQNDGLPQIGGNEYVSIQLEFEAVPLAYVSEL